MKVIIGATATVSAILIATILMPTTTAFQGKIVNGTQAMAGEFPFMVSLRRANSGRHVCGASLLNRGWVLTAAHCVRGSQPAQVNLQYGSLHINPNTSRVVNVSKIIVHERYSPSDQYVNDIALLKLATPLQFNELMAPVRLPEEQQKTPGNATVTLIGWGFNVTGGNVQQRLQKVQLMTFTDDECSERHQVTMHATNICAGVPEGGKGQCSGDSGGPLLLLDGTQIGIVSWSRKPCTVAPYPGVYTEVSAYVDWLVQTIGDEWEQAQASTSTSGESAVRDDEDESLQELQIGNLIIISIRRRATNGHFCAGTVLSTTWILTAAHCFTYVQQPHEVLVHPYNRTVRRIVLHEGYNPTVAIHDIALLQLTEPLDAVQAVSLPPVDWMAVGNEVVVLTGWGLNETHGSLQSSLKKVVLRLIPLRECAISLHALLHATNLCAHAQLAGQCSGDSGGPLLLEHDNRYQLQVGIVSWSRKPCTTTAGVFTNVAHYVSWINEQMDIFSS